MAVTKKQKITLSVIVIALLIVIIFLVYQIRLSQTAQVRVDDLSKRAQEFIEEEKRKSGSSWRTVDFVAPEASQSANIPKNFQTHCFSLQMPLTSHSEHVTDTEEGCSVKLKLNSPPGWLVVSASIWSDVLDENANVSMRMRLTDEYQETPVVMENYDDAKFFSQKDGAVLFLQKNDLLITIALSQMTQPERASLELLQQIAHGITEQ